MDMRAFGARIRDRRETLRLKQSDISGALQITVQAVSKWERGENAPDISMLSALARLLGVSIEWLLGATHPDRDTFPATVFCTSVNGFASRAAVMPPRDLAAWINSIFFSLTEAVKRFDGIPVKYVGDGFLCFFTGNDHAARATRAALSAATRNTTPGLVITLNTGDIYLGSIGHPDYAVKDILGATVNTAFLTMQWVAENCHTGIGVTSTVIDESPLAGHFEEKGVIEIRGGEKVIVCEPFSTAAEALLK